MSTRKPGTVNVNLSQDEIKAIIFALSFTNSDCPMSAESNKANNDIWTRLQILHSRAQDRLIESEKVNNREMTTSADVNPIS